jgi:hypothetical protein
LFLSLSHGCRRCTAAHIGQQARSCTRHVIPSPRRCRQKNSSPPNIFTLFLSAVVKPLPLLSSLLLCVIPPAAHRSHRRSPEELSEALMLPMIKDRSVQIQVSRLRCRRCDWY